MIVVDCSVVVDALVGSDAEEIAPALLDEVLAAPSLLDVEVVSALRGLERAGHLSTQRAYHALDDFDQLAIRRWGATGPLRRRMFDLRANLTAYDAAYVVLAEALECPLLTRDRPLARAAARLVDVRTV